MKKLGFMLGWIFIPYIMIFFRWKNLKIYQKGLGMIWGFICLMIAIGVTLSDSETDTYKITNTIQNNNNVTATNINTEKNQNEEKKKREDLLKFNGKYDVVVEDKKVIVKIDTNAIDGSIFEVTVMNGDLSNIGSQFVTVENGKATAVFDASDWKTSEMAALVQFRFNVDTKPQPDHVKELYGEKGEKLKGSQIVKNHLGGYNADLGSLIFYYPNKESVDKLKIEKFQETLKEIINLGNGLILAIKPSSGNDWGVVNIVVSDAWYYAADFEKKRFAETVGTVVENAIINAGLADSVLVYFKDSFGATVAEEKLFGGYKIVE